MGLKRLFKTPPISAIFIISFLVTFTKEVQLAADGPKAKVTISSRSGDIETCLKPDRSSKDLAHCFSLQMLRKMQDLEEKEEFNLVDGVSMRRDEAGPRDISNFLDKDPSDLRSIMEGASSLLSRRAMQWDMSYLQPGLTMRIGPTLAANGVLEFIMDPRVRDREGHLDSHEQGTARLLTRTLLVPFLLGFKFQLSTLMPLLFGLMVLLSKKALILAKIAVVASSVFGYNSLFGGGGGGHLGNGGGYGGYYPSGPGLSAYGNRYNQHDHFLKNGDLYGNDQQNEGADPYYGSSSNHPQGPSSAGSFPRGDVTSPEDLRERLERLFIAKHGYEKSNLGVRNFAWNE